MSTATEMQLRQLEGNLKIEEYKTRIFGQFFLEPLFRRQRIAIARAAGMPWAEPRSPDMCQMIDEMENADVRGAWRRIVKAGDVTTWGDYMGYAIPYRSIRIEIVEEIAHSSFLKPACLTAAMNRSAATCIEPGPHSLRMMPNLLDE